MNTDRIHMDIALSLRILFVVLAMLGGTPGMGDDAGLDENNLSSMKQAYKAEFLTTLSKLIGQEVDPNDPKAIQAAEAFFATDAAKSYAYTRIHGVALEFCRQDVELKQAMERYRRVAKVQIALGEIYYAEGFDFMLGQQRMVKTGQELTTSLNQMLAGIRQEYLAADAAGVQKKCRESITVLRALADFYGGTTTHK
jgi:hypothetical protein